jgi:maltooligosyltrehalose trehalohydrolase
MIHRPLGPQRTDDGRFHFLVWAPNARQVEVRLIERDQVSPLKPIAQGYHAGYVDASYGERYLYRLDGERERPDPASRCQPDGVHGPSQIVDPTFSWSDAGWSPPSLRNTIFYEMHIGTFTPEGTFEAVIPHLERLHDLGVTALNIMPIGQFPGPRNWGYDGVYLYAPHVDYGGTLGFKRLVDAAHGAGLAVYLDVVYNHLGPEGNYLWDYGPYFTTRYQTPWGPALNFDGRGSDEVRRFFIDNAIYWLDQFHVDGFRIDATHALFDFSAVPFLEALGAAVHDWAARHDRRVFLIAENDRSSRRLVLPTALGGAGMDGQWLDDLHHALHNALTGETDGYYADYGDFALLPKVLRERFAYSGQYSPYRQRRHGTPAGDIPADRYVVAAQNHDQVGNRMLGERLSALTDFDGLKLSAALIACSPYVPLLFMGEEYGETAPFLFFTSHGDAELIAAVRAGRREEFADFDWRGEPPDPQAEETFLRSKLDHELRERGHHAILYQLYRHLLALRRERPALTNPHPQATVIHADLNTRILCMERHAEDDALRIYLNFNLTEYAVLRLDTRSTWRKILDGHERAWCTDASTIATAPDRIAPGQAEVRLPPRGFAIYDHVPEETSA